MTFRRFSFLILVFASLLISVHADDTWSYKILDTESSAVDGANTNTYIDYEKREITLPRQPMPNISDFMPGGSYNFAILKEDGAYQYVFDGSKYIEIATLKTNIDSPLAIALSPIPYNMTISKAAADGTNDLINYQLSSGTMVENPILSVSGIQQVYSMATFKSTGDLAVLNKTELNIYTALSDKRLSIPSLQVSGFDNPIAVATTNDYNFAVLEKSGLKWYSFDGSGISQIPAMSLTFDDTIENPKALAIKEDIAYILNDNQVSAYKYDGSSLKEHAAFSITSSLYKPYSIALKEDTSDLIIVDAVEGSLTDFKLKYFMFNGVGMVENPSLEIPMQLIMAGIWYMEEGEFVTSVKTTTASYADYIKVKAYCEVPKDTQITFYVANEGATADTAVWHESWRIRNPEGTEILEKAYRQADDTIKWEYYGPVESSYPSYTDQADTSEDLLNDSNLIITEDVDGNLIIDTDTGVSEANLWTHIKVDRSQITTEKYKNIRIKAVLKTTNKEITPKIFAPIGTNNTKEIIEADDTAIRWEVNASPEPVVLDDIDFDEVEGWIYTTTPEFEWEFNDPDMGDNQGHYQVIVLSKDREGDWGLSYDSFKQDGDDKSFELPTSSEPDISGPLWASNSYEFAVAVRTWDTEGGISPFSRGQRFNVLAFERPRISNIVNPPEADDGSIKQPISTDFETHIVILPNTTQDSLPIAKAGAEVTILIDSIGPIETLPEEISKIYILDSENNEIIVDMGKCTSMNSLGLNDVRNRWSLKFWTKAPITEIPDNTLIMMKLIGEGEIGGTTVFNLPSYAEGIISTKETIYKDWQVVLEGSDK